MRGEQPLLLGRLLVALLQRREERRQAVRLVADFVGQLRRPSLRLELLAAAEALHHDVVWPCSTSLPKSAVLPASVSGAPICTGLLFWIA